METMTAPATKIQEMEELINSGQVGEVENVWLEAVEGGVSDPRSYLKIAQRLATTDHKSKAANLLELLVEPLIKAGNPTAACEVVNSAAALDTSSTSLKDNATKAYTARFGDVDGFTSVVENAEKNSGGDTHRFVEHLRNFCSYKPGDYLYHDAGWGLGKVVAIDLAAGKLTIDFADTPGHQVDVAAATKFFRKLPAEHILARKAEDPKALRQQSKEDPIGLMRCVLSSLDGVIKLKRVKEILTPDVVGKTVWTKWWNDVKKELTKNGYVRIGSGANPTLELLHIPVTVEMEYTAALQACHTPDAFVQTMRRYLRESGEAASSQAAFLKQQMELLFTRISNRVNAREGEKVIAKLMLDEVRSIAPDVDLAYDLDVAALANDRERVLSALPELKVTEYERRLLDIVRDTNANWADVFADALLVSIPESWDYVLKALDGEEHAKRLSVACHKIVDAPKNYPEQMLWLTRQVISESSPQAFGFEIRRSMFLNEVFLLGSHLYHRVETGDKKRAQPILLKFRALLAERDYRILRLVLDELDLGEARHLMHAVKMNRALSDTHIYNLHNIVNERFPELAAEEEERRAPVDDADNGPILTTPAGLRRIRKELSDIMNVEMPAVQKMIGEALALGDISENAELDVARDKESMLKNAVGRLSQDLERAKVVTPDKVHGDTVGFGTRVTLKNVTTGHEERYTILGRWDADSSAGIISDISAIAQGISGGKPGEQRTFKTPDGGTATYEVVSVSKAEFDAD
ncbi:MAG: GreA/GreB family elongation factor [Planctomycetes bacterium]|nr:GreA/GreB family elongation factor [Planctomycetota bacterium]NUQ35597.1 GreA/GreB family elongation factor [Planctomycetaceae bacterium]